jgi:hypothetical protein
VGNVAAVVGSCMSAKGAVVTVYSDANRPASAFELRAGTALGR